MSAKTDIGQGLRLGASGWTFGREMGAKMLTLCEEAIPVLRTREAHKREADWLDGFATALGYKLSTNPDAAVLVLSVRDYSSLCVCSILAAKIKREDEACTRF